MESFRYELDELKNNDSIEALEAEKARLEDAFNSFREEFERLYDLESEVYNLKSNLDGIDSNLRSDVDKLFDEVSEFKYALEEKNRHIRR
ncbi:hypothetical protein OFR29_01030 [Brachyspira hyodysenteriae]|nr:hypothetical protein [Brachyspira hyodysenteriae]MDA0000262.1 hypothetical protein [Brachyspira hyodysenteriae]MDA0028087.1 hypothetical protein [Brachyspira hyodysenteriae]